MMVEVRKPFITLILSLLLLGLLPTMALVYGGTDNDAVIVQLLGESGHNTILAQSNRVQVIPAAAFIQASDIISSTDDANSWVFDTNFGFLTNDSATNEACLVAPIDLPIGSTISNLTVYIEHNFGTDDDITIFLDRTSILGNWDQLAQVTSRTPGVGIKSLSETISSVNGINIVSSEYNYHVSFCLPADSGRTIKIYGAEVGYTTFVNLYLPFVVKPLPSATPTPTPTPTPIPLSTVLITNSTGGLLIYKVFDTPEGDITCPIPDGAHHEVCGTFTPGTYDWKGIAHCGEKVGRREYKPGDNILTPARCERD